MSRRRSSSSAMGPPPAKDVVMGPPPVPAPVSPQPSMPATSPPKIKDSQDISEKYKKLKRRFFELEEKHKETNSELQRSSERNVKMREERSYLLDRIIELEANSKVNRSSSTSPTQATSPQPGSSAFPRTLLNARARTSFIANLRQAIAEDDAGDDDDPLLTSRHVGPDARRRAEEDRRERDEVETRETRKGKTRPSSGNSSQNGKDSGEATSPSLSFNPASPHGARKSVDRGSRSPTAASTGSGKSVSIPPPGTPPLYSDQASPNTKQNAVASSSSPLSSQAHHHQQSHLLSQSHPQHPQPHAQGQQHQIQPSNTPEVQDGDSLPISPSSGGATDACNANNHFHSEGRQNSTNSYRNEDISTPMTTFQDADHISPEPTSGRKTAKTRKSNRTNADAQVAHRDRPEREQVDSTPSSSLTPSSARRVTSSAGGRTTRSESAALAAAAAAAAAAEAGAIGEESSSVADPHRESSPQPLPASPPRAMSPLVHIETAPSEVYPPPIPRSPTLPAIQPFQSEDITMGEISPIHDADVTDSQSVISPLEETPPPITPISELVTQPSVGGSSLMQYSSLTSSSTRGHSPSATESSSANVQSDIPSAPHLLDHDIVMDGRPPESSAAIPISLPPSTVASDASSLPAPTQESLDAGSRTPVETSADMENIMKIAEAAVAAQKMPHLSLRPHGHSTQITSPVASSTASLDPNLDPSLLAQSSSHTPKSASPSSASFNGSETGGSSSAPKSNTSNAATTPSPSLSSNPYLSTILPKGGSPIPPLHPMAGIPGINPYSMYYSPGAPITPTTPSFGVPFGNPYYYLAQPMSGGPSGMYPAGPSYSNPNAQRPPPSDLQRQAKPKRLKAHTVTSKSFSIPMVPRDKKGKPMLPLNVGIMTVINLGDVCMREHFHTERYIFPVGYEVTRRYLSTVDPNIEVVYHCTILDGGDGPKFQIVPSDVPDRPVIAGTATGAWSNIVKQANAIRNRQHSNSVSGPDFFGLGQNTIKHLIQELPNADRLRDYVWQNFVEGGPLGGRHAAVIPALPEEYDASMPIGAYYPSERDKLKREASANPDLPRGMSHYPQHILAQAEAQRAQQQAVQQAKQQAQQLSQHQTQLAAQQAQHQNTPSTSQQNVTPSTNPDMNLQQEQVPPPGIERRSTRSTAGRKPTSDSSTIRSEPRQR